MISGGYIVSRMGNTRISNGEGKSRSELRQNVVSGDWVVIATGRAKRPHDFLAKRGTRFSQEKRTCPFEKSISNRILIFSKSRIKKRDWWVQVVPNKFPAFGRGVCAVFSHRGPYQETGGVGFHEVIITRDHLRSIGEMNDEEVELIVRAYQERYIALKDDPCVEYISIFHNHGRLAGASISHPHSQIIAIPVISPDIRRSVEGSRRYFHEHKKCVHCVMIRYERAAKKRIIYENDRFVVFAPYASKSAFETRIFPKFHSARFEDMAERDRRLFAHAFRIAMGKIFRGLRDPDYNFFLHTAPVRSLTDIDHYHWHFEILPKTAIWAGFEIGTGIEISVISPEAAAKFLRGIKV